MPAKIRTVVADDSVSYRTQIRAALADVPGVEVVQTSANGRVAVEYLEKNPADLLILDLEMPELDGLQTLGELKRKGIHVKTIVFSSASRRGADITMEALREGATDFIPKPSALGPVEDQALSPSQRIRAALASRIEAIFPALEALPRPSPRAVSGNLDWNAFRPEIVVIGASTGGPSALEQVFSRITSPPPFPVIITQHMPPVFTAALADRISRLNGIPCAEAKHQASLQPGTITIAPGDYHLRLQREAGKVICLLDQEPKIHSVRPAVDPLFQSAAEIYGPSCLGIVLTGMGMDGRDGAVAIKGRKGAVLIQEEKSCVVFGMPGAVQAVGAFDRSLSLDDIADSIMRYSIGRAQAIRNVS